MQKEKVKNDKENGKNKRDRQGYWKDEGKS